MPQHHVRRMGGEGWGDSTYHSRAKPNYRLVIYRERLADWVFTKTQPGAVWREFELYEFFAKQRRVSKPIVKRIRARTGTQEQIWTHPEAKISGPTIVADRLHPTDAFPATAVDWEIVFSVIPTMAQHQ